MLNARNAVRRIKDGGQLSPSDLVEIRARLAEEAEGDDFHNLLRALALSVEPSPNDVMLISKYLENNDDYAQLGALYALCSYWGMAKENILTLRKFTELEVWREKPDLSYPAIRMLGKLALEQRGGDALNILVNNYYNNKDSSYDKGYTENILMGIRIALGESEFTVDNKIVDPLVIDKILKRAAAAALKT